MESNGMPLTVQEQAPGLQTRVYWFDFHREASLEETIETLPLKELMNFQWQGIPLGPLCLPGLRWILRIHHLNDDEATRYLLREYILSAWNVAQKFSDFLKRKRAINLL